jgi:hypothetical protein
MYEHLLIKRVAEHLTKLDCFSVGFNYMNMQGIAVLKAAAVW